MYCMGVASGCGEQEVGVASGSGWNLWVCLLGVVVRWYYRFPHSTYPYSSCICSFFTAASLLFVHLKKCFSFVILLESTDSISVICDPLRENHNYAKI